VKRLYIPKCCGYSFIIISNSRHASFLRHWMRLFIAILFFKCQSNNIFHTVSVSRKRGIQFNLIKVDVQSSLRLNRFNQPVRIRHLCHGHQGLAEVRAFLPSSTHTPFIGSIGESYIHSFALCYLYRSLILIVVVLQADVYLLWGTWMWVAFHNMAACRRTATVLFWIPTFWQQKSDGLLLGHETGKQLQEVSSPKHGRIKAHRDPSKSSSSPELPFTTRFYTCIKNGNSLLLESSKYIGVFCWKDGA